MSSARFWFIDFDDTLALGPTTWAVQTVLPEMIRRHALPADEHTLTRALLHGQAQAASGLNEMLILDELFDAMGWPDDLKPTLIEAVFERYTPTLFADAIPFLQRLREHKQRVFILSNNNQAPQLAEGLGIVTLVEDVFTPKRCAVSRGKPDRALWDCVLAQLTPTAPIIIGDDPWSEGAFAAACEIDCILVDRLDRFANISAFPRVRSLAEIAVG
ncbi:MAG: HAD family hydrolase [Aggregatilineales bacterium]